MSDDKVIRVAEILKDAGWRDNCDAQWTGLEKALPDLAAALTNDEAIEALRWYQNMAKEMGKAAIHGNSKRMLDLMKEIAVDYGKKAGAGLGKQSK